MVVLGARDKVVLLSARPRNLVELVTSVLTEGYTSSSRDTLKKLIGRLGTAPAGATSASDLTAVVITRAGPAQ